MEVHGEKVWCLRARECGHSVENSLHSGTILFVYKAFLSGKKECVWGVAYQIPLDEVEYVRTHLDYREKGGYVRRDVIFHPHPSLEDNECIHLTVYIGTYDNPHFLGPAPIDEMAHQIYQSVGPSGRNIDYLMNLAKALRDIAPHAADSHLFLLEEKVKALSFGCSSGTQTEQHDGISGQKS